jgi:colanic acid/amylovoran biosynthesis glycosyltransferase
MESKKATRRVAYVVSRLPKITETFILYEILELQRLGLDVSVFAIQREHEGVMHAEAVPLIEQAHYGKLTSWEVVTAQLSWLLHSPRAYVNAWWRAIKGNLRSPKFLVRAFYVVPLAAHFGRRMQQLEIQHVHATWATHPALAAYVIRILTGIPYSFAAHSHEIYVDRTMLGEKIRRSEFFITISEYNRKLLTDLYGREAGEKMHLVRCGVDTELFCPRPQRGRNKLFTILCVASLETHKGHTYLIKACAELKKRDVAFRCLLVGEGNCRRALESLIRARGLVDQVQLLGRQDRDRIAALMHEADVLTLQSVMTPSGMSEGIPVSLMEAMAAGLPVIASSIRGIPELVEHGRTGLLIPDGDAVALTEALMKIYSSPELARALGSRGREKVIQNYNLRANTQLKALLFEEGALARITTPTAVAA